jgi:hypothetical protein
VFYRDRIVRVGWDGVALCAVTIEPFEVSSGVVAAVGLWDFNRPGRQLELLRCA